MLGKRKREKLGYKLVFRDPPTLHLLERACLAADVEIDKVIDNPQKVLDDLDLSPSKLQAFCNVVLHNPPNLSKMRLDAAAALGYYVLTDFFLHAYMALYKGRIIASFHFMKEQGSPRPVMRL